MHDDLPEQPAAAGYRIERLLGVGGMAAVYEARRLGPRGPGERVACKVMHQAQPGQAAAGHAQRLARRELARREAVLGLRVTAGHPGLVRVLDYFDDARGAEGRRCIVMELVDGPSVAELRGPDRRLPFAIIRRIACEVLEALVYLHGLGVLHRDLSPRNLLVSAGGAMKVADLGIAKVTEQGQAHTRTFRGVLEYASPEAIEGESLDARSDLFTLAAVLFDLVAGVPPCGPLEREATIILHMVQGQYVPLPPDTPSDLAALITGLLRTAPDDRRPHTAREALALLRDHGQPMASPAELVALVASARARYEAERAAHADARPPDELAPGYVLAPYTGAAPPQRIDAFDPHAPAHASDDMLRLRLRVPRRAALLRTVAAAAIVACALVLGLLGYRLQGPPPAPARQPAEVPALVAEPALRPVAPVAPSPSAPERRAVPDTRPPRSTGRSAGPRRERVQRGARPAPLRRPAPVESEPPPWGAP